MSYTFFDYDINQVCLNSSQYNKDNVKDNIHMKVTVSY